MMWSPITVAATAAALFSVAEGHGYVAGVRVNGQGWTDGQNTNWFYLNNPPPSAGWRALNQDNGFVEPAAFGTSDIACHKSARPSTLSIRANAGDTLTLYWNTWPDSHKGPIINYIAPVSNFASATAANLRFSKISQAALVSGSNPGTWVTDNLIRSGNFSTTVRIPPRLRAGNYILRHEIIALHSAGQDNGAQAYPQCLNVVVGGSGTVAAPAGTAANALYTRNHPGIVFNLYQSFSSYPMPGPALWTGAN
ncbi:Polysaccharide monooxygenase Cel61a [Paramyrothecium foliicola]|nr:Polysaccharide monooxygenase Cel61a [Paramyrothecium foliicola]